jgi:hypothetical protein
MSAEPTEGESSVMSRESVQEPMEEDLPPPPAEEVVAENIAAAEAPLVPKDINQTTFHNRYRQLQEKELDNGNLSVDEYIELFLTEVVQNLDCARQTLARGKQQYPKESLFLSIQGFLCFNYASDFTGTLKKIKAVKKRLPKFEHFVTEITNRIYAYGIATIVNCYSPVKVSQLSTMLDLGNENEVLSLVKMFNWVADSNGVVKVSNTPEVQAFVTERISTAFGPFNGLEKFKSYAHRGSRKEQPVDNLKKMMKISDTLSKIILPPSVKGENEDKSSQSPNFSLA